MAEDQAERERTEIEGGGVSGETPERVEEPEAASEAASGEGAQETGSDAPSGEAAEGSQGTLTGTSSSEGGSGLPLLEEISEPLEGTEGAEGLSEALLEETEVSGVGGAVYRSIRLIKKERDWRVYEAQRVSAEGSGEAAGVWLWEAVSEAGGRVFERVERALSGFAAADKAFFLTIFERFEWEGRVFLATEPVSGETLGDLLAREGAMPGAKALGLAAQAAYALGKIHAAGFGYLGLRAGAVLNTKPLKLVDFSYLTPLGEAAGFAFSHGGMTAPEVSEGKAVDARADVYSVGALLFQLTSGRSLGETGAALSLMETPVAGLPQLLSRCLGSEAQRFASMGELHGELLKAIKRGALMPAFVLAGASSIGLEPSRTVNEDSYAFLSGRWGADEGEQTWAMACVADGMGGMAAGEAASQAAVKAVLSEVAGLAAFSSGGWSAPEQVEQTKWWARRANEAAYSAMESLNARGGCTLAICLILNKRLTVGHVGDCRIYLYREGALSLLTVDHSLVMAMVKQGQLEESAIRTHPERSKIMRSLGERRVMPDYYVDGLEEATGQAWMELRSGDVLMLCSDGLWEPVVEAEMAAILDANRDDLDRAAQRLVAKSLEAGGPDNSTVALIEMMGTF